MPDAGSTDEVNAPALEIAVDFFEATAEVIGLGLVADEHLPCEGSKFTTAGVPDGATRGVADDCTWKPDSG